MEPVHFAEKYILTPGGIPGCVIAHEVTRLSSALSRFAEHVGAGPCSKKEEKRSSRVYRPFFSQSAGALVTKTAEKHFVVASLALVCATVDGSA